jgi:hypothetical protein
MKNSQRNARGRLGVVLLFVNASFGQTDGGTIDHVRILVTTSTERESSTGMSWVQLSKP